MSDVINLYEIDKMKDLIDTLNQANRAYYQDANEIMPNVEYDRLYDELIQLENTTGIVFSNSPTRNVGYEVVSELPKEKHESPMLSLDKTKSVDTLADFLKDEQGLLSWKLDGLTVVLTYEYGELVKAVTRGNGHVGEVITENAKSFENVPLCIPYDGKLVVRGEAVIKYSDFEEINRTIDDVNSKYKNPRNLCSGSVRQLDSKVTANRHVNFIAFTLVSADDVDFHNSIACQYEWLENQGFDVVERKLVTCDTMQNAVSDFSEEIKTYDYPSDGLVLMFDDIAYGISLGVTSKFPRNGLAFKWQDEKVETTLRNIEWSASRTGLINPIAVFDSVELEGTTVSRASVHNVSIVESLKLGIGDTIKVYKANMIIPQISENLTQSNNCKIPDVCPVCGSKTVIRDENGVKTLYCENIDCAAKQIKAFSLFVSRDAFNIAGLSEETLEKLIDAGFISEFADLFNLQEYEDIIVNIPGFGQKSYDNLIAAIDNSKDIDLAHFIYSLGIPYIGVSNAKILAKFFDYDLHKLMNATFDELVQIDGIGDRMANAIVSYFSDSQKCLKLLHLLNYVTLVKPDTDITELTMDGLTFVVTGSVEHFPNRNAVKDYIEKRGGKVTGSVTSKTDYLINNDALSSSSKNKKAKQLDVPIITEEQFLQMWE